MNSFLCYVTVTILPFGYYGCASLTNLIYQILPLFLPLYNDNQNNSANQQDSKTYNADNSNISIVIMFFVCIF